MAVTISLLQVTPLPLRNKSHAAPSSPLPDGMAVTISPLQAPSIKRNSLVHEVLGLKDSEFQSLYHFTVGSPVLDKRIMSLPAYPGPGIDA